MENRSIRLGQGLKMMTNYHSKMVDKKRYIEDPERQAKIAAGVARRKEADPEKCRAHYAVSNAVRDGRLRKPDRCSRCNDSRDWWFRLEAHHEDYSKPLEVTWLCPPCHRRYT